MLCVTFFDTAEPGPAARAGSAAPRAVLPSALREAAPSARHPIPFAYGEQRVDSSAHIPP